MDLAVSARPSPNGWLSDGASVAITYASSPQKADEVLRSIDSKGGHAVAIRADSADVEAVRNAVAETVQAFGGLDILVNNAGIATLAPVDEFKLAEFDRLIAVNVRGVFVAVQAATRHMKRGGRVINIGGVNSDLRSFAGWFVLCID